MKDYKRVGNVTGVQYDGTPESCREIIKMLGHDENDYEIHIYGGTNNNNFASLKHKTTCFLSMRVPLMDYVIIEPNGDWNLAYRVIFETEYRIDEPESIYAMITHDPTTGTDVSLYTELDDAISAARQMAVDLCRHDDSYTECEIKGWLFHVEFSCEGGYCYVVEKEVN